MGVYAGSFYAYSAAAAFSAAQIDSAVTTGAVPTAATGTAPATWSMLYAKGTGKINIKNEVLDLGDDVRGTLRRIVIGEQEATIELPLADIGYQILVEKFGLNPADKSSTAVFKALRGSYDGEEITGFPLIIQMKEYGTDTGYTPKLGSGSDPMTFCFFNFIPDTEISFDLDPKGQRIPVLKGKCVASDGATTKGHIGVFGSLTALA